MVATTALVKKRAAVLSALRSSGSRFVSGQELADALGVSRAAIAKYIRYFRIHGYRIETKAHYGYHLSGLSSAVIPEEVALKIADLIIPDFIYLPKMASTNDIALKHVGRKNSLIVITEVQTGGRGRRGRSWSSPPGGLWFSIMTPISIDACLAGWLPLAIAIEIAKVLNGWGMEAKVKWPNDILVKRKKIGGILIESLSEGAMIRNTVIGIGINANFSVGDLGLTLDASATTIMDETEHIIDRPALLAKIYTGTTSAVGRLALGNHEYYRRKWSEYDALTGRRITVEADGDKTSGLASGIDAYGRLLLKTKQGIEAIASGTIQSP